MGRQCLLLSGTCGDLHRWTASLSVCVLCSVRLLWIYCFFKNGINA